MSNFRICCRTVMLTYKSHIKGKEFDKFKGVKRVWHETGKTGYLHTHALLYNRKKYDSRNCNFFDINDIHPNIKKVLTKKHWENCKKYAESDKKSDSDFVIVLDTLSGNEYLWCGEARENIQAHTSWNNVINDDSLENITMRHLQWAKEVFNHKPKINLSKDLELNKFQWEVFTRLSKQNNRQILWVCDKKGGAGKSTLTNWLIDEYNAFCCNSGKMADFAYAYQMEKIVVFDLPRTTVDSDGSDYTPYRILECLKDGRLFSSKYQSCLKRFESVKVVVFANFMPKLKAMTHDRWDILEVGVGNKLPPTSLNIKEKSLQNNNNDDIIERENIDIIADNVNCRVNYYDEVGYATSDSFSS